MEKHEPSKIDFEVIDDGVNSSRAPDDDPTLTERIN
jgi:hypothetical protein